MRHLISIAFLLTFALSAFSEPSEKPINFDDVYAEILTKTSLTNLDKAIFMADSLIKATEDINLIPKAIFLKSMLLLQKGDTDQALDVAKEGEKFAFENKLSLHQARFCGLLSSQYRLLRLFEFGEVYLEKGIKASKLIEDEQERYKFLGSILLESASYDIDKENFEEALKKVKQASIEFRKVNIKEYQKFYLTNVSNLNGSAYYGLDEYKKAIDQYKLAIDYSSNFETTNIPLKAQIVSGLGRSYLMLDSLDSAIVYLNLTKEISESAQFAHLQIEIYPALAKYYLKRGDYENYALYNEKFLKVYNQQNENEDGSIDGLVQDISKIEKRSKAEIWLLSSMIALIILLIIVWFWYKAYKAKELKRFQAALTTIEAKKKSDVDAITKAVANKIDSQNLSEKDKKILMFLDEHSKKDSYTKNCSSLSLVSEHLGVSKEYLDEFTKTHKNIDFVTFINKSMVFGLIYKIDTNPEFKKYRLEALAEEAGFESKSQFISAFESITGFKPSKYLILTRANNKTKKTNK